MGSRFIINQLSSSAGRLVIQPWKGGGSNGGRARDVGGFVLINSGGSAHSTDFSGGSDVSFYVSGSLNTRGSKNSQGTAVFGGDLLTSGAFYVGEVTPGSAPPAGLGVVYVKSDGSNDHLYFRSSDVSEVKLSSHVASSVDIDALDELAAAPHATQDEFMVSDNGTEKRVSMTHVAEGVFALVTGGDATIASNGSVTIAATSVEGSMLNNNIVSGLTDIGAALLTTDELIVSDGGTIRRTDLSRLSTMMAGAGLADSSGTLVLNIDGLSALSDVGNLHQTNDHFLISDGGTEKKITLSDLEDEIFGNVSGDATIAAGGALTLASNSVSNAQLDDDAVDSAEIAAGAVDDAHLSDGVATGLAGTVTATGLAASSGVLGIAVHSLGAEQIAAGDFLAFSDVTDNGLHKESIDDIATLFAGAGMTATSAVLNVIGGNGITANANDVAITAAQTTITSVLNAALALGRDADNQIKFATDDTIVFEVAGGDGVTFKASGEIEATSLDISGDADIDGTLEADAITVGGTALNTVIAGVTVANATLAATTTVTDSTANTNFPVVFHNESNALLDDTGAMVYNPSTGLLTVPNITVSGTTTTVSTTNMLVKDKLVTLNDGGAAQSGTAVGLEIEEDGSATGYIKTDGTGDWTLRGAGTAASNVLTVDVNATKTLTVAGALNIEADSIINQDLSSDSTTAALGTLTIGTSLLPDAAGGADLGSTGAEWGDLYIADDKAIHFGTSQEAKIEYDEDGSDQLHIHAPAAGVLISGTTPTLTIGDAGAEDTRIVFDGNAQDFHIGLDDTDDKLKIGLGAAVGTTPNMVLYSAARTVEFLGGVVIPDAGSIGSATDTNAITISSAGVVALTSTTAASSTSTGALTVAGGASVADDFWVGDNLRLASDGAILSLGIGHDITLIHDGGTGATLASAGAFVIDGAAAVTIDSDAALTIGGASMDIDADGGVIDIDATSTVSIDSSAGSVTMGAILADGQTLTLGKTGATAMVFTPHGTAASEKISLTNTAGTADDAIDITSTAGGITLESNASKEIEFKTSAVNLSNQSTDIEIKSGDADALEFVIAGASNSQMLSFNTNDNEYATAVRVLHGDGVSDNYFATFQVGNWGWGEGGNSDAFMMVSGTIGGKTGGAGGDAFEPMGVSIFGGDLVVSGAFYVGEYTPASAPGNGLGSVYVKNDGSNDHLYFRSHDVSEVKLSGGGGSGVSDLDDLSDVTYSSGDLTISSLDTIIAAGNLTLDVVGDITFDADGGQFNFNDAAATHFLLDCDSTTFTIYDDQDTGDLFKIQVAQHGATTISTVDDDATAGNLTLDIDGDIVLDADGGDITFKDAGTAFLQFTSANSAADVNITNGAADGDLIFADAGGNEVFRMDGGEEALLVAGTKKVMFGSTAAYINHDGTDLQIVDDADINLKPAVDLLVDAGGDIHLDAGGSNINFKEAGTTFASINEDGDDAYLNFGTTAGTSGYGIQDDAGTIKIKNSGGGWAVPVFNGYTSIEIGDTGDSLSYSTSTADDSTLTSAAGGDKLYIDAVFPLKIDADTSNHGIRIRHQGLNAQQVDIADSAMQVGDAAIEITAASSGNGNDAQSSTQLSTTYYSGGRYDVSLQATASGGSHWATISLLVVTDGTTCTVSEQRVDTGALGSDVLELTSAISGGKIIIKAQNISTGAITNLKTMIQAQGLNKLS